MVSKNAYSQMYNIVIREDPYQQLLAIYLAKYFATQTILIITASQSANWSVNIFLHPKIELLQWYFGIMAIIFPTISKKEILRDVNNSCKYVIVFNHKSIHTR